MRKLLGSLGLATLLGGAVFMAFGAKAQDRRASPDVLAATVEKGDLAIEVELAGAFVAEDKDEIRMEPDSYRGDLIVTQLVPEGRAVKKGDILMEFDRSSLEDSLEEAQDEVRAKSVEHEKALADLRAWEIDLGRAKERQAHELEKAQKALGKSEADLELTLSDKKKGIEDAARRLHDAEVDLEQLQQLYEERELHTATENILLERQRNDLADTKRAVGKTQREFEIWTEFEQGTELRDKGLDLGDKQADIEKKEVQSAAERKEKEAAVAKAERALKKAEEKVAELEADAESLRVESPRDGIAFYGSLASDSYADVVFIGMSDDTDEMKIGGRVRTHQVLMTVASMERLAVKMSAPESDIQYLKEGLPITIRPDAFPALAIEGQLTKVDQVASRQSFLSDVRQFSVTGTYDEPYPQLRSGMNCRVTVRADSVPDCLQVPVLAVFSEGGDHYCMVVDGAKRAKRKVKVGSTNGTRVEIQEGLRAGESVALHDVDDV